MKTGRNIVVYPGERPMTGAPVEMCEHKGIGHPDTVTDAVCEAVALALVQAYEDEIGGCLHFNVDKGLLVGGRSAPRFGGGTVLERPKLIVCGRASNPERRFDMDGLVLGAARRWLDSNLSCGASSFELSSAIGEGSANLREVIGTAGMRANDTSFGVGYAPLSALESKVLRLSAVLRSTALREQAPCVGEDCKVMGLRVGDRFTFTVAIAMVDRHLAGVEQYFRAKEAIRAHLAGSLDRDDEVWVNRLDDADARDERGVYVTVTGLSAEMGDDGQVGRGNRVNGLIAPGRATSLEAAAGKNPYAHTGKIYNVLAHEMAADICRTIPEVPAATVRLLSAIGQPLDAPHVAAIEIAGEAGPGVRERVRALIDARFDDLSPFLTNLAHGRFRVF